MTTSQSSKEPVWLLIFDSAPPDASLLSLIHLLTASHSLSLTHGQASPPVALLMPELPQIIFRAP
ncbi:hypothetical protein E2C01_001179 [Portunus trituberculatus]|uniref:Uncharacterized protein n=1 Tax=Portunus trituberculatus TaxID=210409 RepID=A0A5B7CIM2_PORTR|nr:hypothetical protein [Portunus trituberculatus]